MFVTGMNSVVPGRLTFHALKANSPGSPVGRSARPSSRVRRAPRNSRVIATAASAGSDAARAASASSSGSRPRRRATCSPASLVKKSSVECEFTEHGHERPIQRCIHDRPSGGRSPEREPRDAGPQPDQHGLLQLAQGHRLGLGRVRQRARSAGSCPARSVASGALMRASARGSSRASRRPGGSSIAGQSRPGRASSRTARMLPAGSRNHAIGGPALAEDALLVGLELAGVRLELDPGGGEVVHRAVDVGDREVEDRVRRRLVVGLRVDQDRPAAGDVQRRAGRPPRSPRARGSRRRSPSPRRCRAPRSRRRRACLGTSVPPVCRLTYPYPL